MAVLTFTPQITASSPQDSNYSKIGADTAYQSIGNITIPAQGTPPVDDYGRSKTLSIYVYANLINNQNNYDIISQLPDISTVAVMLKGRAMGQSTQQLYQRQIFNSNDSLKKNSPNAPLVTTLNAAGNYSIEISEYLRGDYGITNYPFSVTSSWEIDYLSYVINWLTADAPTPSAPSLVSPADNGSNMNEKNTVLSWGIDFPLYAASYDLQIADNQEFIDPVININIGNVLTCTITSLVRKTKYYWKVRAKNSVNTGAWSTVRNFTTTGYGQKQGLQMIL